MLCYAVTMKASKPETREAQETAEETARRPFEQFMARRTGQRNQSRGLKGQFVVGLIFVTILLVATVLCVYFNPFQTCVRYAGATATDPGVCLKRS